MLRLFLDRNSMNFHQDPIWLGKLLKLIMEIGTLRAALLWTSTSKAEWKEAVRGRASEKYATAELSQSRKVTAVCERSSTQPSTRGGSFFFILQWTKKSTLRTAVKKQRSTFHRVHYITPVSDLDRRVEMIGRGNKLIQNNDRM